MRASPESSVPPRHHFWISGQLTSLLTRAQHRTCSLSHEIPPASPSSVWSPRNPDPFSGGTLIPLKALVLVSLFSPSQALCCQSTALNLLPPASLLLQHLFPWADAMLLISPCKLLGLSLTTLVLSVRNVFGDAAAAPLLQNPTAVRQPERNARAGTGTTCSQPRSLTMPMLLHPFAFARRLSAKKTPTHCISHCLNLPAPHQARGPVFLLMLPQFPPSLHRPDTPVMLRESSQCSPEFLQHLPWCKAIYHRTQTARSLKATP